MGRMRRPRYIWFRLGLAVGTLLGFVLLGESIATYYRVAGTLVTAELERDGRRRVASLEREARLGNFQNVGHLSEALREDRHDSPAAIAWIKVIDVAGNTVALEGSPVGPALTADQLRSNLRTGAAFSDIRETPAGKVVVTALPARFGLPAPTPQTAQPESAVPNPSPGASPGPTLFFVEMALYWDSATQSFGRLRRDLVVSSSAALGLVATMIFLWFRLPHFVRGMQLEMETKRARQVQVDMLPPADTRFVNLDFAASYVPAEEVGGDFYDVFPAGSGGFAIVLGDVSGKGLPAAVVVGLVLGALRTSDWVTGCAAHEAALRNLSELLRSRTSSDSFATLFSCYYERDKQVLRYVNAGHPPPVLLRRKTDGDLEVQHLTEGGPVLGVVAAGTYRQGMAAFCEGDLLVMYSDGVVEAENPQEEQFGEQRVLAAIRESFDRSCGEIRDDLLKRVHSFVQGDQAQDDLTLVALRVLPSKRS